MILEYIRYTIPEEQSQTFIAAYEVASASLRASAHCLSFELSRCSEASTSFVLRIVWDSLAGHLQGFRQSAEFRSFFQAIQPFVKQIDEMRHYELTSVTWDRAAAGQQESR